MAPHERTYGKITSQETLTLAAALLPKRKPAEAVAHALRLWHEAGELLADAAHTEQVKEFEGLSRPKAFPATLKDFLRLEVSGKDKKKKVKRLRDFYRDRFTKPLLSHGGLSDQEKAEVETRVNNEIESWKAGGFKDISYWKRLAAEYHSWWQSQISRQAKESGNRPKRSKAEIEAEKKAKIVSKST
jgi:hypothetical protein